MAVMFFTVSGGPFACLPIAFITVAVALEVHSKEIGLPGVLVASLLAAAGPVWYALTAPPAEPVARAAVQP